MSLRVPAMKECSVKGFVHSLETFGSVDGPGVRFVVFLQGCPMRCRYCHNPDTWKTECGTEWTAEELLKRALRYKGYWGKKGGITVSGGEALLQMEFVAEFFRLAKDAGVHTALDTSGAPFSMEPEYLEGFNALMKYTDLVILDIKEMDEEKHKKLTGFGNRNILAMAEYLSRLGIPLWIRHVLVPGLTDGEEELREMGRLIKKLSAVERVEILPYHTFGTFKWQKLGIPYTLEGVMTPDSDEIRRAEGLLNDPEMPL